MVIFKPFVAFWFLVNIRFDTYGHPYLFPQNIWIAEICVGAHNRIRYWNWTLAWSNSLLMDLKTVLSTPLFSNVLFSTRDSKIFVYIFVGNSSILWKIEINRKKKEFSNGLNSGQSGFMITCLLLKFVYMLNSLIYDVLAMLRLDIRIYIKETMMKYLYIFLSVATESRY